MSIFKKYKWYFITSLVLITLFTAAAVWLQFATDVPQSEPFKYQVF